jgi:spore coat polysaccharide biosynthesis protein SpsF
MALPGKVHAYLQARMGSTRLPGKVLLRIQGRTILERAVWRLQATRTVDEIFVLTTTLEDDDAIVAEADRLGIRVHRGPSADVLRRYQQASERFSPAVVVRATADNPLIDIGSVDRIVRAVRSSPLDYCMENELPYGAATEVITAAALARVDREATLQHHREHVTLYVKQHPERFRLALLAPPDALRRPEVRLTVDTPEDFIAVEELIQQVREGDQPLPLTRYLELATAGASRP